MLGEKNPFIFILIYSKMSEYELVKKLGSCDNFKGLKSMAKVPRHKLFARNKLSAPTVHLYNDDTPFTQLNIQNRDEERGISYFSYGN